MGSKITMYVNALS